MKAVTLLSGGLDSVTLAHYYSSMGYDLHCLSFFYGQRHQKELNASVEVARRLNARHDIVDIQHVGRLISTANSSLINPDVAVPDGHYAEDNMKVTIVPNRNAIMLSIAFGVGVAEDAAVVAFAAHGGDHFIYPDCRPEFIKSFAESMQLANDGGPKLEAPFQHFTKADIVKLGSAMGVDYSITWSCYKGGDVHCGTCGTCVERAEAFSLAGVIDPTQYLDSNYWKEAVASRS